MAADGGDPGLTFDVARSGRIGIAEAVLAAGKTTDQIARSIRAAEARGTPLLLTRLAPAALEALGPAAGGLDYDPLSRTAILGPWTAPDGAPALAVVTAGTSDLGIAGEAARTLAFHGLASTIIGDIGVAGLWRLEARLEELRRFPVLIVVAGMDGALFSVLGGLVGGVVIAVPSSTGYGAARGGETALASALASCAPGVVVVNIDSGFAAAAAAIRVLNTRTRD